MNSSRSTEIMLALCRPNPRLEETAALFAAVTREGLGAELFQLADTHRVLGLILHQLAALDLIGKWEGAGDLLSAYREQSKWSVVLELECERILTILSQAGVRPVLLKGAALRRVIYAAPVQRPMSDLDLLIADEDFDAAASSLSRAGFQLPRKDIQDAYRRYHFHLQAQHSRSFMVELHWALSRPGDVVQLDPQGMRASTEARFRWPGPGFLTSLAPLPTPQ